MEVRYDPTVDALAIDLVEGDEYRRAYLQTLEIDGDHVGVDVDADGRALGIEILGASEGFNLNPVIERFGLEEFRSELEEIQGREFKPDLIWKKTPSG